MATEVNLVDVTQGHKAIQALWKQMKGELLQNRKQVITVQSFQEAMTNKQRKYYHGYILTTIAQQVIVEGRKYAMKVWKDHYRQQFLKDKIAEVTDIKTGAIRREIRRVSSESLNVSQYNQLIDQVTADASSEFGVVFDADFNEWLEAEVTNG